MTEKVRGTIDFFDISRADLYLVPDLWSPANISYFFSDLHMYIKAGVEPVDIYFPWLEKHLIQSELSRQDYFIASLLPTYSHETQK